MCVLIGVKCFVIRNYGESKCDRHRNSIAITGEVEFNKNWQCKVFPPYVYVFPMHAIYEYAFSMHACSHRRHGYYSKNVNK